MLSFKRIIFVLFILKAASASYIPRQNADAQIQQLLSEARAEFVETLDQLQTFIWSDNENEQLNALNVSGQLINTTKSLYHQLKQFSPDDVQSDVLKRVLKRWTSAKYSDLNEKDMLIYLTASSAFEEKAQVKAFCDYHEEDTCNLAYMPDIADRIATAKTAEELQYYWQQWRNIAVPSEKEIVAYLAEIYAKVARGAGLPPSSFWYMQYDEDNMIYELSSVIDELRPLYEQLHAFIRHKLQQKFGAELVPSNQAIPQHLMDQIFVQSAKGDAELDLPYPENPLPNVTKHLIEKGYAPLRMFQVSDEFFNSLGMQKVPENFWTEKTKPCSDESFDCTNRILTFSDNDIRMMHCSRVSAVEFDKAVDSMTHIHYEMVKRNSSYLLGWQACPGFSNALSKSVKLSMSSPDSMEKFGLVKSDQVTDEFRINQLYKMALHTILSLPTYYVYELIWVKLLNGNLEVDMIGKEYWNATNTFTGVRPPTNESISFILPYEFFKGINPTSPNTENLFSEILGYQIFEKICSLTGQYDETDPNQHLSNCNLQDKEQTGEAFTKMMSSGGIKSWREVIEPLLENERLNANSLVKYFKPLYLWLKEENAKNESPVGWVMNPENN